MPEPRNDMFPDPSLTDQGVSEDKKTQESQAPVQEPTVVAVATQEKGAQTPDNRLFAALQEERKKRHDLEERLVALENVNSQSGSHSSGESYLDEAISDEGRMILEKIKPLEKTIASLEDQLALKDLQMKFPELSGKLSEFDEYRKDYPRHKLENVAKLFLQEQGIAEASASRPGLESSSGGIKPVEDSTSISAEEVDRIRTTQPRLFIKMIREGLIDPDKIK